MDKEIRQVYFEDIRHKSLITRSSRTSATRFPLSLKEGCVTIMSEKVDLTQIQTKEQVMALSPEDQLRWLEMIKEHPGYAEQAKLMGVKYNWLHDRRTLAIKKLQKMGKEIPERKPSVHKRREDKLSAPISEHIKIMIESQLSGVEEAMLEKLQSHLDETKAMVKDTIKPLNEALRTLDESLTEVRGIRDNILSHNDKTQRQEFEGGYFINRIIDAENLSKRLAKLSDSIGITDSKYKVTISIIELDE